MYSTGTWQYVQFTESTVFLLGHMWYMSYIPICSFCVPIVFGSNYLNRITPRFGKVPERNMQFEGIRPCFTVTDCYVFHLLNRCEFTKHTVTNSHYQELPFKCKCDFNNSLSPSLSEDKVLYMNGLPSHRGWDRNQRQSGWVGYIQDSSPVHHRATYRDTQPFTLTFIPMVNLECPINLIL